MDLSISRKVVVFFFLALNIATSARAGFLPDGAASDDPICYSDIEKDEHVYMRSKPKPIHIDVQQSNPISPGGNVIINLDKSTVPSGKISIPDPAMHPDFIKTASTAQIFIYTAPNRSADFTGKVEVIDTYCGFAETMIINLPVK